MSMHNRNAASLFNFLEFNCLQIDGSNNPIDLNLQFKDLPKSQKVSSCGTTWGKLICKCKPQSFRLKYTTIFFMHDFFLSLLYKFLDELLHWHSFYPFENTFIKN